MDVLLYISVIGFLAVASFDTVQQRRLNGKKAHE